MCSVSNNAAGSMASSRCGTRPPSPGAAFGGVVACFAWAVHAAAAGGGPSMAPYGGVPDGPWVVALAFLGGADSGEVGHVQSCHVEDDGFAVLSYLLRCIILPWRQERLWKLPPPTVSAAGVPTHFVLWKTSIPSGFKREEAWKNRRPVSVPWSPWSTPRER